MNAPPRKQLMRLVKSVLVTCVFILRGSIVVRYDFSGYSYGPALCGFSIVELLVPLERRFVFRHEPNFATAPKRKS